MPGTSQHESAYRPPENRTLEAQVIDRFIAHLSQEPVMSPATCQALAALLPAAGVSRSQILASVRLAGGDRVPGEGGYEAR